MKEHILVDITAAIEYANKMIEENSIKKAKEYFDEYNNTHKKKLKDVSVEDLKVTFEGLIFGYMYHINGYKCGDSANFIIPIDDFIVKEE